MELFEALAILVCKLGHRERPDGSIPWSGITPNVDKSSEKDLKNVLKLVISVTLWQHVDF